MPRKASFGLNAPAAAAPHSPALKPTKIPIPPRLGVGAVKSLSDGETGVLVGWQRNEVSRTPLTEIVGRTQPLHSELLELARILAK